MKTYPTLIVLLTAFMAMADSCKRDDMIKGGGSVGTRRLILPTFHSVETHYDIGARITFGNSPEVVATGYDNLLNIIDFTVENQVLKLKFNQQYNTIRNANVVAQITIPDLQAATIHGSSLMDIGGFSFSTFNARIHGSGNIRLNNSQANLANINIHGSGNVDAYGLSAKEARVFVQGSGHTSIAVENRLEATIQGSGNVYYWGNPITNNRINGSGRIIKK